MKTALENNINQLLNKKLASLEEYLNADVLAYYGNILDNIESNFLRIVEDIAGKNNTIYIVLNTTGGSATAVERFVKILRFHYEKVNFIVPNYAYSAGTIFCMSGDKIFMDYSSVLGPIDPQVRNKDGNWVAALGYLDKVNEFIEKSRKGTLTQAEFLMLKDLDLAELRGYEQAKNLTIDLLKKWLVRYKFKDWTHHKNTQPVSIEEKIERATVIADKLSDSNMWKSHGRPIDIGTLTNELRLKIDDYSKDKELRPLIREYDELYRSNHIEYISEYNKMHEHLINIMPDSKKLSDVAKEFRHILSKRVIPKSIYEDKQEHIIEIIDEIEEKRKLIGRTKNKDEKQKLRVDILRLKDKFRKFTLNITLYELGNDKDCCVVDNEKVIISTWTYNKEFGILKEKDDSGGIFI